jgi:ABC-type branched-subunit amino acid transport system ATPase component
LRNAPLHADDPPKPDGAAGASSARSAGTLVSARRIELNGQWGKVFGPLDLDLEAGGVTVLSAPPGAARTALLMAISGRMKLSGGDLTVLGQRNAPRAVFAESAIACFDELDEVLPSVTVQDLVTEQLRWESPWYRWIPKATTSQVEGMCGYLFEDRALPPPGAFVADLPEVEQMLIRIAVANTRRPPLLVVGRLDQVIENSQRDELMAQLLKLGRTQSIVTADVNRAEYSFAGIKHVEISLLEFQQRRAAASDLAAGSPDAPRGS